MTEFYKEKFNVFYQKRMLQFKKDNFTAWQKLIKDGGLTSHNKEEIDIILRDFIDHIFGKEILE